MGRRESQHLVGLFLAVAAERTSCHGALGTTMEILESDVSSDDVKMVARMVGSVTWRKVDDAARDITVLVGVVAGADPVVTVRDLRGAVGSDIAAHEQDR